MVVMNRKRGNVHNISEHITLPKSPCIHQYGSSPNSVIWGFYREKKKKITSASLTMIKPLTAVDHNKLWKILKDMGIPDHLTCLLRNPCAGQDATVRMGHGTKDWFQTLKDMGIPDHLTCLLRNPCAGQEATVRMGHGTKD